MVAEVASEGPQRSGGERSEPERGEGRSDAATVSPDPEVPAKARRRRFTAAEKLRILREADRCTGHGELGALLRREGLYSSHLSQWRQQRTRGELKALAPRKRGPGPKISPEQKRIAELERKVKRLEHELEVSHTIIDVQKKVAALLGNSIETPESRSNN
jgi:transposase-like protein